MINNIIADNQASNGGGIRSMNSKPRMINNTIVNNLASNSGGGLYMQGAWSDVRIINSIFWDNTPTQIHDNSGNIYYVYNSDVQGRSIANGNIDADPLFADTLFNLSDSSQCIGAGADSVVIAGITYYAPDHDFFGNARARPQVSNPDIGAIEHDRGEPLVAIDPLPGNVLPQVYSLQQNYPNPINPATTIEFTVPKAGWVGLTVYNLLGEVVASLVSEPLSAGQYRYRWDAGELASSMYYYRMTTGSFSETRKMLLIR